MIYPDLLSFLSNAKGRNNIYISLFVLLPSPKEKGKIAKISHHAIQNGVFFQYWYINSWYLPNLRTEKTEDVHVFLCTGLGISVWLAQLVRESIRWVVGNEFNSWVDDIFHLPVLCDAQNEMSPKKAQNCYIMYKSHSQGHSMPFLRVNRKGEVLNKHSNYIIL